MPEKKETNLDIHFHNPNTEAAMVKFLCKVLGEELALNQTLAPPYVATDEKEKQPRTKEREGA